MKLENKNPVICTSRYYENIARNYFDKLIETRKIDDCELLPIFGGIEGYLKANFGVETIYSGKILNRINEHLGKQNKKQINILDTIMSIYPVITDKPEYSLNNFEFVLKNI